MKQLDSPAPDIRAVGALAYRYDERGRPLFLLIRKRGGYWTLPKGKLEPGEDDLAGLARELKEETGLGGAVGPAVRSITYQIVKGGRQLTKNVTYYLVRVSSGKLKLSKSEQIVKAGWYAPTAALRRLHRGRLRVVARKGLALLAADSSERPSGGA